MKPNLFKQGARDAWRALQGGSEASGLLAIHDDRDDDYQLGWIAQCEDPDAELYPPEPDGDAYVQGMTGIGLAGVVGAVVCWAVGLKMAAAILGLMVIVVAGRAAYVVRRAER